MNEIKTIAEPIASMLELKVIKTEQLIMVKKAVARLKAIEVHKACLIQLGRK